MPLRFSLAFPYGGGNIASFLSPRGGATIHLTLEHIMKRALALVACGCLVGMFATSIRYRHASCRSLVAEPLSPRPAADL
jgi:hypothetical protein